MAFHGRRDSFSSWERPLCLIESELKGQLTVNDETVSKLDMIIDPVVVVAIVGPYRTGKSYLLNQLSGHQTGFELGSTIQSKTKGIWIWCIQHPVKPNFCLALLDTEGLGDVEKGNTNHDIWIFTLAVLLSSNFIYNSKGTIAQQSLNDLHFVTSISDHIQLKAVKDDEESVNFDQFFPSFIWVVRDFTLELDVNNRQITEDEYLEHALKLKKGYSKQVQEHNLPRECLRQFFKDRKCFVFPWPVKDVGHLKDLDSLSNDCLDQGFASKTRIFLQHVYHASRVKNVNGKDINGRMLAKLAKCYVEAIRNGDVPCIETAVETTAKLENEKAIKASLALYKEECRHLVQLPAKTVLELSNIHHACEKKASEHFLKLAIFDSDGLYYIRMVESLKDAYNELVAENDDASRRCCQLILQSLHRSIEDNLKAGTYTRPGGYQQYKTDLDQLVQRYNATSDKGVLAEETIKDFMKSQDATAMGLLKADEKLTEEAKRIEEEKQKSETMKRERIAAETALKKTEQMLQDEKQSADEHINRLQKKMEEDQEKQKQQLKEVVEKKLKEQNQLLNEGFEERSKAMNEQIQSLKESMKTKEKSESFVDTITKLIGAIHPVVQTYMHYNSKKDTKTTENKQQK